MVKAWKEKVVIPTYEVGKPEKNPIFLEKRVYQGSSGVVYPYPVIESMSDEKVDKEYNAIFIENEYIKVMILPELSNLTGLNIIAPVLICPWIRLLRKMPTEASRYG